MGSVDNKANIEQAGNDNTAVTTQKNTGQSDADTRQVGDRNRGYILQQGDTNLSKASIDTKGSDNFADVIQQFENGGAVAGVVQDGERNDAKIKQDNGDLADSRITQISDGNRAVINNQISDFARASVQQLEGGLTRLT